MNTNQEILNLLIDKGANINQKSFIGANALFYTKDLNKIKFLIEKGINTDLYKNESTFQSILESPQKNFENISYLKEINRIIDEVKSKIEKDIIMGEINKNCIEKNIVKKRI